MDQKTAKANDPFFVVDEHDNPLKPLPRKDVHGHGIWHRVSHVWFFNDAGQVLCQQRSLQKEMNPGFWEPFFGGHIKPGESYEDGALREITEELGIHLAKKDLKLWKVFKFHHPTGYNNEFQAVFITHWNGSPKDVIFNDGEVEQVTWKDISEVVTAIRKHGQDGWTNCGYELTLLEDLEERQ